MTPDPREDEALQRMAEAIADAAPAEPGAEGTSPLLRHMEIVAEAAAAFREAGDAPAPGTDALFAWGPLQVRRRLGAGSFGEVFAAWDPRLRREVALKLRLDGAPGSARRWLDEARALAQVRHPGVLTVHGADEYDGRAGLWTDLVEGRDLEAVLQAHGPFSAREAAGIGQELCAALAAVHARALVHGDVKTRNVMRAERGDAPGRLVLMDFGSAHEASLAVTAGRGTSVGTPLAMAPEVLRGEPATPAADLYSLGALLFRLVSGRYPVEAATLDELRAKQERGERLALRTLRPELPRAFVQVVERALESDPAARFPDAAAMERALGASVTLRAGEERRPLRVLAFVALAAVMLVAGWLVTRRPAPPVSSIVDRAAEPSPSRTGSPLVPAPGAALSTSAPAVATPQPLALEATLYRGGPSGPQPLSNGGRIAPGDRLWLEVESPEAVHVYVLDEDEAGALFLLFPMNGSSLTNPLSPSLAHRLPGSKAGEDLSWQVTSAGGRETFLVVASRTPLPSLQQALAAAREAREGEAVNYADVSAEQLADLRGVGGVVREPAAAKPASGRLHALAGTLAREAASRGLWLRLVEVDNPAP